MERDFDIIYSPDAFGNKKNLGLFLHTGHRGMVLDITEEQYREIKEKLDIEETEIPF